MISRDRARELALAKISLQWSLANDEPVIADERTKEEGSIWVFFYNSKRFVQTKDAAFQLAGNGPVVVEKESGEVTMLGSVGGSASQIAQYFRKKTEPNQPLQRNASTRSVSNFESPARRG
jgi:hypothetical protein